MPITFHHYLMISLFYPEALNEPNMSNIFLTQIETREAFLIWLESH